MQTGCVRETTTTTDHMRSNKANLKSVTILPSSNEKCLGTDLTEGDHEGRVEQTQICPVRVIHYSPGTRHVTAQVSDSTKTQQRVELVAFNSVSTAINKFKCNSNLFHLK